MKGIGVAYFVQHRRTSLWIASLGVILWTELALASHLTTNIPLFFAIFALCVLFSSLWQVCLIRRFGSVPNDIDGDRERELLPKGVIAFVLLVPVGAFMITVLLSTGYLALLGFSKTWLQNDIRTFLFGEVPLAVVLWLFRYGLHCIIAISTGLLCIRKWQSMRLKDSELSISRLRLASYSTIGILVLTALSATRMLLYRYGHNVQENILHFIETTLAVALFWSLNGLFVRIVNPHGFNE